MAAAGVLAPLLWASAAGAHASLTSTSPAAGAVLAESPPRITLAFDGRVDVVPRSIRLVDADGHDVALGPVRHDGPSRLTASVSELGTGSYVVAWRVVSADSHPISGAFTFSVRAPTPRRPGLVGRLLRSERPSQAAEISIGAARWLSYAGLALWVGTVGVLALCDPSARRQRRAPRLFYAACVAGVVGTAWMIAAQAQIQVGRWWSPSGWHAVIDTSAGRWWTARLAGFVLAATFVHVLHRHRGDADDEVHDPPPGAPTGPRAGTAVVSEAQAESPGVATAADVIGAAVAAVLIVIVAGGGHGITGRWVPLGFAATAVHLATMGLWAGGLAALLAFRSARRHPPSMRRFSSVALWCIVTLAVTGVFNAWREAGSLSELTGSPYGNWLYLKLALIAVVLLVASRSRRLVRPGVGLQTPGPGRIATLVGTEVVVMALVLGATAGLVSSPPPREAALRPETRSAVQGDRFVQVTLDPPVAGGATMHVYVQGPGGTVSRPDEITVLAALPARGVTGLDLTDRLQNAGPGHLVGRVELPLPGTWQLTVTARFGRFEAAAFELEFEIR